MEKMKNAKNDTTMNFFRGANRKKRETFIGKNAEISSYNRFMALDQILPELMTNRFSAFAPPAVLLDLIYDPFASSPIHSQITICEQILNTRCQSQSLR